MTENNVPDYEKNQLECERLETQLRQLREKNATPEMMKQRIEQLEKKVATLTTEINTQDAIMRGLIEIVHDKDATIRTLRFRQSYTPRYYDDITKLKFYL
jgi:predicted RNase H-like nuclease (RuvC/YqgF family)